MRRIEKPTPAIPINIIIHVAGSGTAGTAAVASVKLSADAQRGFVSVTGLKLVTEREEIVPVELKPRKLVVVGFGIIRSMMLPRLSVTLNLICAEGMNAPLIFELKKNPPIAEIGPLKFENVITSVDVSVEINTLPELPGKMPLAALT